MKFQNGVCWAVFLVSRFLLPVGAQEIPEMNPQTAVGGRSLPAKIFAANADSVVFMTGVNVKPEKKELSEFFQPAADISEEWTVGTGFIIHPDGYILTNAHAVLRSVTPVVELRNGSRYDAEVLCIRPEHDLALLKIEAKETLTAVSFEENEDTFVGDTVLTIGCPHSLKHTLTYGLISGTNRSSQVVDIPGLTLRELLQTDASINPGSSGGPWFNTRGKVMAMTVSKRGDSDNIAFGISIATLHQVLPEMVTSVLKMRFDLGFEVVRDYSTPFQTRVTSVTSDSAAEEAGLRVGDNIRSVNGMVVGEPLDFYLSLLSQKSGDTLQLRLIRSEQIPTQASSGTENQSVPSAAEEVRPDAEQLLPEETLEGKRCSILLWEPHFPETDAILWARLRMKVDDMTPELRKPMGLRTATGVLITERDTAAFEGLKNPPQRGDVLAYVNSMRPRNREHLMKILLGIPPETPLKLVFLRVNTKNNQQISTRIDIQNFLPTSP